MFLQILCPFEVISYKFSMKGENIGGTFTGAKILGRLDNKIRGKHSDQTVVDLVT